MVRVDLNTVSVVGLLLGLAALALVLLEYGTDTTLTVATVLGPGAPWARVQVWMIIAVAGVAVYLAGRILWLLKHRFPG